MFENDVARGAEWLDENVPGWERRIDLSNLRMHLCTHCVVGQAVYGFYQLEASKARVLAVYVPWSDSHKTGFFDLLYTRDWRKDHGFELHTEFGGWRDLEAVWTALVKERFDTGLLSDLGDAHV